MSGLMDVLDREDADARHARCDEFLPALPAAWGRWRQPPAARRGARTAPLAAAGDASWLRGPPSSSAPQARVTHLHAARHVAPS